MFKLYCLLPITTLLIVFIISIKAANNDVTTESEYIAPGTVSYPLGDESLDNNILEDSVVNDINQNNETFKTLKKCIKNVPITGSILQDAHIQCPEELKTEIPKAIIYSSADSSDIPQVQCRSCDIRLTEDSSAVLVRCNDCYDIPNGQQIGVRKNRSEVIVNTLVYYLEIANYISPEGPTLNLTFQ